MDNYHRVAGRIITYGMLKKALVRLGLVETIAPGYLVYEDAVRNLVIVLPTLPDSDPVRPVHFSTARWTLVEGGITNEETFEKSLVPPPPRPKARTRSAGDPPARRLARRRPAAGAKQAEAN